MKIVLNIEGDKIKEVKGDSIEGVDIVMKDGRVFHLDSNLYGDFTITEVREDE
ncbi:hypothetical protein [Bacillus phage vB_BanS-Thrax3]|nr:hypothetical protein [Bacillus phage vB_BanS-Thrax3]